MDADFQREYQMNLAEQLWGPNPISMRRFQALINGLPLGSALVRSIDPLREGRGWRLEHELLAVLIEQVDLNTRTFVQAHLKKGAQAPKPIYIPRPDDTQRKAPTSRQVQAVFATKGIPIIRKQKRK